jgi:hypothetical protein
VADLNLDCLQQVYSSFCVRVKLFEQLGVSYKGSELDVYMELHLVDIWSAYHMDFTHWFSFKSLLLINYIEVFYAS